MSSDDDRNQINSKDSKSQQLGNNSNEYQKVTEEIQRLKIQVEKLKTQIKEKLPVTVGTLKDELKKENKKLREMMKKAMEIQKSMPNEKFDTILLGNSSCTSFDSLKSSSIIDTLANDNETLQNDRLQLHEQLLNKDKINSKLEEELGSVKSQLNQISSQNVAMANQLLNCEESEIEKDLKMKMRNYLKSAKKMESEMESLQNYVSALREEVERLRNERGKLDEEKATTKLNPEQAVTEIKFQSIKSRFEALQCDFIKKEKECVEMKAKMRRDYGENCDEITDNKTSPERVDELMKEIEDNGIFIRELQGQVEHYREKFMKAQTKVEQQKLTMKNLEAKSEVLDQQVNDEIAEMKRKFHDKLSELCDYPRKYQESQLEVDESKKKIQSLESDLKECLRALCESKDELTLLQEKYDENLEERYKQLQCENLMMKKNFHEIEEVKKSLEDKLENLNRELELIREESAKIIRNAKQSADQNRLTLSNHIHNLEIELAQCRASTSISQAEKQENIQCLRNELTKLCDQLKPCSNPK